MLVATGSLLYNEFIVSYCIILIGDIVMSKGRRSQTAFIWLLHLPGTAQEGRGQIDLAPPPHLRCPLLHGAWEVEQPCFLVGNNQLTSPTPYTPYYYRPELVMLLNYTIAL